MNFSSIFSRTPNIPDGYGGFDRNANSGRPGMEALIPLMNKIQDAFAAAGQGNELTELPQIAVVGAQSSGKSSVLEGFVGRSFLPRGTGIVTRCPIVLRLVHEENENNDDSDSDSDEEWCEFQHAPGKRWTDFTRVRDEILSETDKIAGNNKGITNDAITLTIHSPQVVTLTVVDLPGLVKNPTGDQPDNIESQVDQLVRSYISSPSTIILAVTAGNTDIATSESLKLAREVDPDGRRTLAVITKLDTVDPEEDMTDVLTGKTVRLKYGFIGVINRSQKDIQQNKPLEDVRRTEMAFLNKRYPHLISTSGMDYLTYKLNHLLVRHIFERLPGLESMITNMIQRHKSDLDKLAKDDIPEKSKTMMKIINDFIIKYRNQFLAVSRGIDRQKLCAGAKIDYIFQHVLDKDLREIDPLQNLKDDDIKTAVMNSMAMEFITTTKEAVFQDFVKQEIPRLETPSLKCLESVYDQMTDAVINCLDEDANFQFPRLRETLVATVVGYLNERLRVAENILRDHVQIQASYVTKSSETEALLNGCIKPIIPNNILRLGTPSWTKMVTTGIAVLSQGIGGVVPNVVSAAAELAQNIISNATDDDGDDEIPTPGPSTTETVDDLEATCIIVKTLIKMYFENIRSGFRDFVPKLITHSIIYHSMDNLSIILTEHLHNPEKIEDLIRVSDDALRKRRDLQKTLQDLNDAIKTINEIRETDLV